MLWQLLVLPAPLPRRLAVQLVQGRVRAFLPDGAVKLDGESAAWLLEDGVFSPLAPGLETWTSPGFNSSTTGVE